MPLEDFLNQVMRNVVGVLANNIGWHSAQTSAVDILADLSKRYLLQLARGTHNYAEHFGRSHANLNDASLALRDMGVNLSELEEYIQNFDPVLLPYSQKVPEIPVKRESKLNFLRPGSEEVLTRAMHVHEYMPPMIFEKKEPKEETTNEDGEIVELGDGQEMMDTSTGEGVSVGRVEEVEDVREPSPEKESNISEVSLSNGHGMSNMEVEAEKDESSEDEIEALENGGTSSRKFTPFSGLSKSNKRENVSENPALKRMRMILEEEGHPLREITSAMMTSSGFLSSSREGRLPDTRPPPISREFFEPLPPPPLDKKKKVLTMKRIVEGVKKIEKENDTEDAEEPTLFGNPDKIKTSANKSIPVADLKPVKDFAVAENGSKGELDHKKVKKLKKLKLDKKKLSKGLDRDKKKLKIFKKAQQMKAAADKALLKKSKKFQLKEFTKSSIKKTPSVAVQESLDMIDSDDDFGMDIHDDATPSRPQPTVAPMIIKSSAVSKKKEFSPISDVLKIAKTKESKSVSPNAGLSPHLVSTPKTSPLLEGGFPTKKVSPLSLTSTPSFSPDGQLKKKRGRPRKNTPLVLTPAALANLGRGLMQEKRQLKIKKSHMEPDVRSLIPEISISTPTPPKANRPPPNLNLLPSAPGLIPTGSFGGNAVKMPAHIPPSISITPATPSIMPGSPVKDKNPFGGSSGGLHHTNVCSSITITPIDMPNAQKLPTPYDKTVTPGIGSPSMQQTRPNKPVKQEKPSPPNNSMQMPIKGSGITITPIVMKEDRFANEPMIDSKLHQNNITKMEKVDKSSPVSGLKLDDDLKAKEQRRKEKERRKELKKEKKKEKKEKEKLKEGKGKEEGKEKKEKKDKSEKKKEKKKDKLLDGGVAISSPPYGAVVPKLTLKLSGHSGTPTPVDSPNPPPVTIDYEPKVVPKVLPPPPPLTPAPKKIVFKPIEDQVKMRTPSPELARFSPLVTRAPKPGRAAKAHAAAAVAAEAMGALMGHQMASFPPENLGTPGSSKRGRKPGPGGKSEKAEKVSKTKVAPTVTTLVTETVGWFEDEHGNKIWICPSCGRQDDGSPMIGCDICDDWYHFVCVGITETPAEDSHWFCPRCEKKKHKKDRKK